MLRDALSFSESMGTLNQLEWNDKSKIHLSVNKKIVLDMFREIHGLILTEVKTQNTWLMYLIDSGDQNSQHQASFTEATLARSIIIMSMFVAKYK